MKGLLMSGSFSDSPTHDDKFSIENYINGLSNFITECETPLTLFPSKLENKLENSFAFF